MKNKKVRIIERTHPDGSVTYVIQQKFRFLFTSWWDDVMGDSFNTLDEAINNLCYHDGSRAKDVVVYEKEA